MTTSRHIRCFDYVNRPYAAVRDALRANALQVFQAATTAAARRADSLAAELHVEIAGIDVGTEISIDVHGIDETKGRTLADSMTTLDLEWRAARAPGFFPVMRARLLVYPLTAKETQLELNGEYRPPLGPLGKAANALVGHRVADAAVHRFIADIGAYLRQSIPA